ncbi:S-adenosylmethionine:tRNA ribosyltransferase-isomerase [Planctopirus ephydatiae]|uniref:S-adenosylmethionine:tRNA ribosyltransferase-isomerase n=1 Tax=Planctopirus ephydatiae TaxID=2528019 RepID=A0A518GQ11_9PLAN|nr:tRNA preQ1(34) S-adenosylmethionine ribosyltransferase-isomerase QueA [Planctopirus ephydatiae]QDV30703.1 S-adenosylmethionine:tRNA ribosyltransferase-isomerase [Planctopirus ephydatiae]
MSSSPDFESLSTYDYELPPELIAQHPLPERDASRMLVIHRSKGMIEHRFIKELPLFLKPHDLIVVNNSKVVPARLQGVRASTSGKWEGLFLGVTTSGEWQIIGQTRGRLQSGEWITIPVPATHVESTESRQHPDLQLQLIERGEGGIWKACPQSQVSTWDLLEQYGSMPLPPYIHRDDEEVEDRVRYQTIFSGPQGSVAAPTAGLHFTPALRDRCAASGAKFAEVTLHVGMGTFRPVSSERIAEHKMHTETCELSEDVARKIQSTRSQGGKVLAIGTTSARTLESAARKVGVGLPWQGETNLFLRPPCEFLQVEALLTNFHVPKSTLLMLVCAMAGYDLTMQAYQEAVEQRYRFLSYGDCMLIL